MTNSSLLMPTPSQSIGTSKKQTLLQKEKARALSELLAWEHAEDYMGTDDDMSDSCSDWIGSLTDDELCDIVLKIYHDGI